MNSHKIWDPKKYNTAAIDMTLFKNAAPLDLYLLPHKDYNMCGDVIGVNYSE